MNKYPVNIAVDDIYEKGFFDRVGKFLSECNNIDTQLTTLDFYNHVFKKIIHDSKLQEDDKVHMERLLAILFDPMYEQLREDFKRKNTLLREEHVNNILEELKEHINCALGELNNEG